MEHGRVSPDTHKHFGMEDFDSDPSRLLVEMNYLIEMFILERSGDKDHPIVITLREKAEHFETRKNRTCV